MQSIVFRDSHIDGPVAKPLYFQSLRLQNHFVWISKELANADEE